MVWRAERSNQCDRCGTYEWEWKGPDGEKLTPYKAAPEVCRGCESVDYLWGDLNASKQSLAGTSVRLFNANGN